MASTGSIGYGLTIGYSADGVAYTNVAQVADSNVSRTGDKGLITNNDSPSARKEKMPGLVDPGSVTFNIIYKKSAMTALMALLRLTRYWKVTCQDNCTFVDQGFITELKQGRPVEDKETLDVTVEYTGKETWTEA